MSKSAPRVSVGLPVFNGEPYLESAVDSVLAQSFTDFELIISDNASTDRTEEICRAYATRDGRIRYYRDETNLGAAANFNRTFELAIGEYFKWFAHDDVLAPRYLDRCVERLDRAPDSVVLCFPRRRFMTPDGRAIDGEPHLLQSKRSAARSLDGISFARLVWVCDSRFPIFVFGLMRAAAVRKTRLMGTYIAADLVFVAEMRLLGELCEVPEELYFQRLHAPTPEVLDRMTRSGDVAWFDPSTRGRWLMPEGRLLIEYVRSIRRSELTGSKKAWCYCALIGQVASRARRHAVLFSRRTRRGVWSCWSRMSLAAVRASDHTSVPLRLWALSAGLRRWDSRWIGAAFVGPWSRTPSTLLGFAAQRLSQRRDPAADRLLAGWLAESCGARRIAAARAMGPHPDRFGAVLRASLQSRTHAAADSVARLLSEEGGSESSQVWYELLGSGVEPHRAYVDRSTDCDKCRPAI